MLQISARGNCNHDAGRRLPQKEIDKGLHFNEQPKRQLQISLSPYTP